MYSSNGAVFREPGSLVKSENGTIVIRKQMAFYAEASNNCNQIYLYDGDLCTGNTYGPYPYNTCLLLNGKQFVSVT